jgi:hypothetical protein
MTDAQRQRRHRFKAKTDPLPALCRAANVLEAAASRIRETIKSLEKENSR